MMKKKSFKTAHIGEWGSSLRSHSCLLHRLLLLKELYQILLVIRSKVKTAPKMDQRSGCAVHASPLRRCLYLEPLSRPCYFDSASGVHSGLIASPCTPSHARSAARL